MIVTHYVDGPAEEWWDATHADVLPDGTRYGMPTSTGQVLRLHDGRQTFALVPVAKVTHHHPNPCSMSPRGCPGPQTGA